MLTSLSPEWRKSQQLVLFALPNLDNCEFGCNVTGTVSFVTVFTAERTWLVLEVVTIPTRLGGREWLSKGASIPRE